MNSSSSLIVLAAGGTGGHMFPAQALATELSNRNYRLALITDQRGDVWQENAKGIETYHIRAGGIAGKTLLARLRSGFELAIGVLQARKLLKRLKPDVVVGFGGYASVPTMLAASFGGYPTAIHEQNAVLGKANRLLAKWVRCIATSFKKTEGLPENGAVRIIHTGIPLRSAVSIVIGEPYPAFKLNGLISMLVVGGSQGASIFSNVVPKALELLEADLRKRIKISQQCRLEDLEKTQEYYQKIGIEAELKTFFDDAPKRLAESHLLIGRSGASTIAEILAIGRPAILVPYPHAIDDHQTQNAYAIVDVGAGWLMPEEAFTPFELSARLVSLFKLPKVMKITADSAGAAATVNAEIHLADMVVGLILSNRNESKVA
jgi:UDP-N-acetylglucosamine--N-acetylmuramyl-(pentapeptide) pyrophosphoryl-undecaprenol N-acetylglucosamine transferase